MKLRDLFHFFACFLLWLWPHLTVAQSEPEITRYAGGYFEIVGTDPASVYFVDNLGTYIVDFCSGYLQAGRHGFPEKIFVALRPQDRVDFDGDYRIRVDERGELTLDFRWDSSLSLEAVSRAIVEAYVIRYANFNYGLNADDDVRFWAVSALASKAYLGLRAAQKLQYFREAQGVGVMRIDSLLELDLATGRSNAEWTHQGYWVQYALQQAGVRRSDIAQAIDQAIAGVDVAEELLGVLRPVDEEQQSISLEAWWQNQMSAFLGEDLDKYETMAVSSAWITELANFDIYRASNEDFEDLRSIWKLRDDEGLRTILDARRQIIALRLARVNPAYFNAAQSLGALYETVLKSDRMYEFIHAFTTYLSDFEDTKRLQQKTNEYLDALVLDQPVAGVVEVNAEIVE